MSGKHVSSPVIQNFKIVCVCIFLKFSNKWACEFFLILLFSKYDDSTFLVLSCLRLKDEWIIIAPNQILVFCGGLPEEVFLNYLLFLLFWI